MFVLWLFMIFLGQALRYDTIDSYIEKAFSFLHLFLLVSFRNIPVYAYHILHEQGGKNIDIAL